jgi:hypothetical protein
MILLQLLTNISSLTATTPDRDYIMTKATEIAKAAKAVKLVSKNPVIHYHDRGTHKCSDDHGAASHCMKTEAVYKLTGKEDDGEKDEGTF